VTDTPDGGPAFPGETMIESVDYKGRPVLERGHNPGMSMRDLFAAHAMAAIIGLGDNYDYSKHKTTIGQAAATDAYEMADAMLAARKAKP
jgi:hypothetical protein